MKRLVLFAALAVAAILVRADDFAYLTFERADGTGVSFTAVGLEFTFSDGKVVVANPSTGESHTLTLSELVKMYFATADISTSVATPEAGTSVVVRGGRIYVSGPEGANVVVANMSGIVVAEGLLAATGSTPIGPQLPRGIYIIKVKETTKTIAIK